MLKLDDGASALELLRLTDSNDRTVPELAVFHNSMEYHMEELNNEIGFSKIGDQFAEI